ncbi:hypothetical protein SUGI_0900710 [Cryptomeria japonica]|nr:hypothetical protein SUGI_0900710 [Cryptomeria japonica]
MNGFSGLFSANFSAMEAQNGELYDIVGCGSLSFDGHGSSARFTQSDLDFCVGQVENRELYDSVICGQLPFDGHDGSPACFDQDDLFSAILPANKGENEELFDIEECGDLAFDGHGSFGSCIQDAKDQAFNLRIAQGNGKGMDKRSSNCATERVRRKRMKSCFSELASLLPPESNKTRKRLAKPEILSKAMDYICHLKKKVDVLSKKRDEIRVKINDCQVTNYFYSSFKEGNEFPMVRVDRVYSHALITINTLKEHMMLSKILVLIEQGGLQVIMTSSFTIHEKVTHTFHCKVSNILHNNFQIGQIIWQMIKEMYIPLANEPLV